MPQQIQKDTDTPLGATLLRLRGATQNLSEAMSAKDHAFILKRRVELSEALHPLNNIDCEPSLDSLVLHRLIFNLQEAKKIATSMLHDASSWLSENLALAKEPW